MIRYAISIPIKENNRPCRRTVAIVLPFSIALEPFHASRTECELRNSPTCNQSTLIRAPFLPLGKSIPRPELLPAFISHLDGILRIRDAVGTVGIPGIKGAFTGLHGICSLSSGFLHHDGLYNLHIVWNPVLPYILLDHRSVIQHILADRLRTLTAVFVVFFTDLTASRLVRTDLTAICLTALVP